MLSATERAAAKAVVAEISEAIHPPQLPSEVEWFWTTWKPSSFGLLTGQSHFTDPGFALKTWLEDPEWPRALIWVAYESHCFLAVELDYVGSPGPRIYDDCYASGVGL